MSEMKPGQTN